MSKLQCLLFVGLAAGAAAACSNDPSSTDPTPDCSGDNCDSPGAPARVVTGSFVRGNYPGPGKTADSLAVAVLEEISDAARPDAFKFRIASNDGEFAHSVAGEVELALASPINPFVDRTGTWTGLTGTNQPCDLTFQATLDRLVVRQDSDCGGTDSLGGDYSSMQGAYLLDDTSGSGDSTRFGTMVVAEPSPGNLDYSLSISATDESAGLITDQNVSLTMLNSHSHEEGNLEAGMCTVTLRFYADAVEVVEIVGGYDGVCPSVNGDIHYAGVYTRNEGDETEGACVTDGTGEGACCKVPDVGSGRCIDTAVFGCLGTVVPGHCPGSADIMCCAR